jgi:hypothetical protein
MICENWQPSQSFDAKHNAHLAGKANCGADVAISLVIRCQATHLCAMIWRFAQRATMLVESSR